MILAYDTETTNLPLWHEPSDDPRQPHVIQIAMILSDMQHREVARYSQIVKPGYGAVMGKEAFEAHGITLERAMDEGVDPVEAVDAFLEMAGKAELMVGHNESFDRRIMRIAAARHKGFKWAPTAPSFCTLYKSKYIVNLPPTEPMIRANRKGPKPPKLIEAYEHFFGEKFEGAHDALADVEACLRIFRHLVTNLNVPMFKAVAA